MSDGTSAIRHWGGRWERLRAPSNVQPLSEGKAMGAAAPGARGGTQLGSDAGNVVEVRLAYVLKLDMVAG